MLETLLTLPFILIAVLVLLVLFLVGAYNSLVTLRMRVKEAWADIDVQLKKRYDLLPDLIETAKKATAVDENILTKVTQLRTDAMKSSDATPEKRGEVEAKLSSAIRDIKVAVEAYPDIKSHGELTNLMEKVTEIEEKIAYARRFYNTNVLDYNTKRGTVPTNFIASMFNFGPEAFFEANEEERKDVKVQF